MNSYIHLIGPSGVGKTHLLENLVPGINLEYIWDVKFFYMKHGILSYKIPGPLIRIDEIGKIESQKTIDSITETMCGEFKKHISTSIELPKEFPKYQFFQKGNTINLSLEKSEDYQMLEPELDFDLYRKLLPEMKEELQEFLTKNHPYHITESSGINAEINKILTRFNPLQICLVDTERMKKNKFNDTWFNKYKGRDFLSQDEARIKIEELVSWFTRKKTILERIMER